MVKKWSKPQDGTNRQDGGRNNQNIFDHVPCNLSSSCDPLTMYLSFVASIWVWAPNSMPKYLVGSEHYNWYCERTFHRFTYKWLLCWGHGQYRPCSQSQFWYHYLFLQLSYGFCKLGFQRTNNERSWKTYRDFKKAKNHPLATIAGIL